MNFTKNKIVLFSCLITTILLSSTFTTINVLAYDWNTTQTYNIQEDDNIGYGVFDGNRAIENQLLENEYDTDIRYVQLDSSSTTQNMGDASTDFRTSADSSYYNSYMRFDLDSSEWKQLPTYFQAFNNTENGPNLQVTTGVNNQGYLDLGGKTAVELYPGIIYVFKVNLVAGKMFDLNFKTTTNLNYYIFFNDILSDSGSANLISRNVYPLVSRDSGDYFIYLISSNYNYVIIQPREIEVNHIAPNELVAGYFVNEPNNIWNETKQTTEPNKDKETIHAYYLKLGAGTYLFKYVKFDTYDTTAHIMPAVTWATTGSTPSYYDRSINTNPTTKQLYHFEETTTVVIYIDAEYFNTAWTEFDYFFSVNELETPILQPGDTYDYEDTFFYFGIEVEETQAVYFNMTGMSFTSWFFQYIDKTHVLRSNYAFQADALSAEKIVLEPGYYFFMYQSEGTYDLELQYHAVASQTYEGGNLDFTINQRDGMSSNLKLIKIVNTDFRYHNYNISLVSQGNYSVEVGRTIYFGKYVKPFATYSFFRLGYQQVSGVYQPYNSADYQLLNVLSPGTEYVYYLLVDILEVYNNTGYSYPSYGIAYSEPVSITLRFKEDTAVPEALDAVNINYVSASLSDVGSGTISRNFDTAVNNYDLYIIQASVPLHTWYNLKITINNGLRDSNTYSLKNYDGIRDYRIRYHSVWNRYICLDPYSNTLFVNYDSSNITNVLFEVEFGTVDTNLIFMFAVSHVGTNGSITFNFVPHDSTLVSPNDPGRFPGGGLGLIGSIILGIVGGGLAVAAIVILIVKVIIPKSKTPSQSY